MYNIKVYSKSLVYRETISLKKLENITNFSGDLNGGVSNMNITLDLKITNTDFIIGDILKIYYKGDHIYSGSVLDVGKLYGTNVENLTLILVGYGGLMTRLLKTETYSTIASTIAKDIIDDFNTEYGSTILSYDGTSIPTTVGTIDLDFTNKNYLDCLKALSDTVGLKFYINIDGKVYFREKSAYGNHKLTTKKDVEKLEITEEGREIVNSLTLKNGVNTQTYTNATSITNFGKKEKYLDKSSELTNQATGDVYGASYITENGDKKTKIIITVNDNYDYFTIKPGDTLKVRNTGYDINDLQIVKVEYHYEKAKLFLEKAYSFANEIFNNQ